MVENKFYSNWGSAAHFYGGVVLSYIVVFLVHLYRYKSKALQTPLTADCVTRGVLIAWVIHFLYEMWDFLAYQGVEPFRTTKTNFYVWSNSDKDYDKEKVVENRDLENAPINSLGDLCYHTLASVVTWVFLTHPVIRQGKYVLLTFCVWLFFYWVFLSSNW